MTEQRLGSNSNTYSSETGLHLTSTETFADREEQVVYEAIPRPKRRGGRTLGLATAAAILVSPILEKTANAEPTCFGETSISCTSPQQEPDALPGLNLNGTGETGSFEPLQRGLGYADCARVLGQGGLSALGPVRTPRGVFQVPPPEINGRTCTGIVPRN